MGTHWWVIHINNKFIANLHETGRKTKQTHSKSGKKDSVHKICHYKLWAKPGRKQPRIGHREYTRTKSTHASHWPSTSLVSPMRETLERSEVRCCTEEGDPPERRLDREKTAKVWVIGGDTYWSICWNVVWSCSSLTAREAVFCFRRVSLRQRKPASSWNHRHPCMSVHSYWRVNFNKSGTLL